MCIALIKAIFKFRWSLRLRKFNISFFSESSAKYSDTERLSPTPVVPSPQGLKKDGARFGIVVAGDLASQQRSNPKLSIIIDHMKRHDIIVPEAFERKMHAFIYKISVSVEKNFGPATKTSYLPGLPAHVRDQNLNSVP